MSSVMTRRELERIIAEDRRSPYGTRNVSGWLEGCDLSYLDLHGLDFTNLSLRNANFTGCNLEDTNLSRADLKGACFQHATFHDTNVRGTLIACVYLPGASNEDRALYAARVNRQKRIVKKGGEIRFWTGCQKGITITRLENRHEEAHEDEQYRLYQLQIDMLVEALG